MIKKKKNGRSGEGLDREESRKDEGEREEARRRTYRLLRRGRFGVTGVRGCCLSEKPRFFFHFFSILSSHPLSMGFSVKILIFSSIFVFFQLGHPSHKDPQRRNPLPLNDGFEEEYTFS